MVWSKKLWYPRLCPLPLVTLNHLCTSGSAYARMFIATKLRVAFRAQASASQRCVTLRNLQFASNLWSQCTSRFDDFFCFVLPVCLRIYTQISSCAIKLATVLKNTFFEKTVKTFPSKQDVLTLDLLSQKGSSHFGLKKLPDLASLWEGVELFSRKQGRISPRLKFLLYQYKSEIVLLSSKVYQVFFWIQDSTRFCHIQQVFFLQQRIKIVPVFVSLKQKKRIFETCWYQCTVLVNVICGSVLWNCQKTLVKSVKKQLFQSYCLKSFSAELFWDPLRILAKLSDICYLLLAIRYIFKWFGLCSFMTEQYNISKLFNFLQIIILLQIVMMVLNSL